MRERGGIEDRFRPASLCPVEGATQGGRTVAWRGIGSQVRWARGAEG